MERLPFWFIPAVCITVSMLALFISKVYRLAFGDSIVKGGYSDKRVTLHDLYESSQGRGDLHKREIAAYIENQGAILKERIKIDREIADAKIAMEPEKQCKGCGHNG